MNGLPNSEIAGPLKQCLGLKKNAGAVGGGRESTQQRQLLFKMNSSQVTFLFRSMDTGSPRKMISPDESRLPRKPEMKRGSKSKLIKTY